MWFELSVPQKDHDIYRENSITDLPSAVQKYFIHVLTPGARRASGVKVEMKGEIKLSPSSDWIPFEAQQIIRGREGFVWKAQARVNPLMILSGADYYYQDKARLYFSLFNFIPVVNVSSEAVAKSAQGRLLIESLWIPSALLPGPGIYWSAIDSNTIKTKVNLYGDTSALTLLLGKSGNLRAISMMRYQTVGKDSLVLLPFGAFIDEEKQFEYYTIPIKLRVGWNFGTPQFDEFFRAEVLNARFF